MNHLNCFVLEAIAHQLGQKAQQSILKDCFSNSPDEITFSFESIAFKCLFFQSEIFFSFDDHDVSKSRLFKPQFSDLIGLKIKQVEAHQFERSYQITFEDEQILVFKCHGRKSNIIQYQEANFMEMFRKNLENDAQIPLSIFQSKLPDFYSNNFDCSLENLKQSSPFLPEEVINGLSPNFTQSELQIAVKHYQNITAFDYDLTVELIPNYQRNTLLADISAFSRVYIKAKRFTNIKSAQYSDLLKKITEKKLFIQSNTLALENIKNKRSDEEIGNIILANLHLIPPSSKKVQVVDIYNNNSIEIKLDDEMSAVDNASKYFKKAKGVPHTLRLLGSKIENAKQALLELEAKFEQLNQSKEWKDLKPLLKVMEKNEQEIDLPYRKFQEQSFDILVGKNADSNEKILNYFSDKDDVWLHAKDVSGSHVLIKCPKNKKLPESVLNRAASLAAYYSKNRNQNLATVTYTLRKYVRKIKGAEKGKVSVSQEQTLLVKPSLT